MLRNAWNLGHIAVMLPAAKVLHVVRHPMDVTLSCYAQPFEGRGTPWAWDLTGARLWQLTILFGPVCSLPSRMWAAVPCIGMLSRMWASVPFTGIVVKLVL